MDVTSVQLLPRAVTGKKVKTLRKQGMVPVHLYGNGLDSGAFQVDALILQKLLRQVGTNIPLSVKLKGKGAQNICFVREVQRHPVTEDLLHVDFMQVDVSQTVRAEVPIVFEGTAPAVRSMGGTLLQSIQSILVESLPLDVPASIEIDVSDLDDFEKSIHVSDISVDAEVTIITNSDDLIARVSPPRIEVEEVEEAAEEEEEGEVTEGDAKAAPEAEETSG